VYRALLALDSSSRLSPLASRARGWRPWGLTALHHDGVEDAPTAGEDIGKACILSAPSALTVVSSVTGPPPSGMLRRPSLPPEDDATVVGPVEPAMPLTSEASGVERPPVIAIVSIPR
jgi:hypothetical protein